MSARNEIADYLDVDLLARLPNLEFRARFLVDGFFNGLHASPFRGSNVEFREHRKYHPGDDISDIDWKAYARTDRLHVRIHEDDTNLNAHLLLDRSASMNFRGPLASMNKWDYARSIAAALLLFLNRQKDASTLTLVGKHANFSGHPASTDLHFRRQLQRLAIEADSGECNWHTALTELEKEIHPRSIVILISDFYTDPASFSQQFDQLRAKYPIEFVEVAAWRTTAEKVALLEAAGFRDLQFAQTLTTHPLCSNRVEEQPVEGYDRGDYVAVTGYKR